LDVNLDEGDSNQVVILNLQNWQGASIPEINVSGQGQVVVRGAGRFLGDKDELGDDPEQDHDNILGDDQDQILFFGPGDDVIRGAGGNDIVASSGGQDQLFGDGGNDLVIGGADADILYGGDGDDTLQGGLTDAGTWNFSLGEQGLHVQFTPEHLDNLPKTQDAVSWWHQQDYAWSHDARVNFTSEPTESLEVISSLYHAAVGQLPTLDELNEIVSWNITSEQLADLAFGYYQQHAPVQIQEVSSQVRSLVDHVWGEDVASEEFIDLGTDYILNGGSWSEGMLFLALHENHQQPLESSQGELQLTLPYTLDETGWAGDNSADHLIAGTGDDTLIGGYGDDLLDGGDGEDTAIQVGNSGDHQFLISTQGQLQFVHQYEDWGVDILIGVEEVRFADQVVDSSCSNMDADQLLDAAALHQLITSQAPTLDELNALDSEYSTLEIAENLLSKETASEIWGNFSNREFVAELSGRVLENPLSEADLDYWQEQLDSGVMSRSEGLILALGVNDYQVNLFGEGGMILG
jgi:Ca2+-binding RTX toxin-like protein